MFENEYVKIWIKDGILYFIYKIDTLTLDIVTQCVKERIRICNGITYPMFGDISNIKNTSKEAREYLASGESLSFLSAGALLIKSQIEKFLGNFWLNINKPKLPARLFTDEKEAVKWLENYRISKLN